uniref:S-adenosylmethionine decarboxylase proenzyme n=1 Tax=Ditylenchus dipsaci TaxID=166011 RepID=A0A915DWN3_9BILA
MCRANKSLLWLIYNRIVLLANLSQLPTRAVPRAHLVGLLLHYMSEEPVANVAPQEFFFEGAEKLLEIWFEDIGEANSLRQIPRDKLVEMLALASCHILHCKSNSYIDSYVLSESSMFISDRRFILKTCGNTQLLATVDKIMQLAREYSGMDAVANVYYSRKNFLKPNLQPVMHRCFDEEVQQLDNYFSDGGAFCMGSLKQDRWYLYTLNSPQSHPICSDHTLEMLMSDVPPDILQTYSMTECKTAEECTKKGGILQLLPAGAVTHEELFEPVGYSMNALLPDSDQYFTIHITPQPEFSFVSFETNQQRQCLYKQTLKVLDCFKPNKFMVTIFSNELSPNGQETQERIWKHDIPGYKRTNLQFLRLQYDTLVYAQYVKNESNFTKIRRLIEEEETSNESDG